MQNNPIVSSGQPNKVSSNPAYQGLYDANPYSGAGYYESPWQQFLSSMGFRTGANAWQENMAVQSAEYNAQIAQKQYDEEYNLPINQVARMRAAGLNPDINGGEGINPGEAQQPGQDPSTPMMSQGDEGMINQVVNGVMSCFSSALGMIQTFQGIQGTKLNNVLLSIEGEKQFSDFSRSISHIFLPDSPHSEGIENFDWQAAALKNAEVFAGKHLPKSMQSKFLDFQKQFWQSAIGKGESYEDFKKRVSNERGYALDSKFFWSEITSALDDITAPLAEMNEKIYKARQGAALHGEKASEKEAIYSEGLYGALDSSAAAEASNETNRTTASKQSSLGIVQDTIQRIMSNLEQSSKKDGLGGALANVALALISGLYLYVQSGAGVSVHSGSFSGEKASGSNRGFSLDF